jgi:drug/metabolite transporter (DMT)-like permease
VPAVRLRADLALTAVSLGWGASFLVIKDALAAAPPHWLLALRFGVGALALALFAPRAVARIDARTLRAGLGLALVLWAAFALQTVGLVWTTPAKSAFLTAVYVPLVPVLGRLVFGTALPPRVLASVALALVGLALLTHPTDLAEVNRGDALTLGCAVAFALHIVLLDRVARDLPARPLALLQIGATGALALPVALAVEGPPPALVPALVGAVLYLGVVCSAAAYVVQTWAQRHTLPERVALLFSLEAVFAAVLAAALIGERHSGLEWTGGALVVAAVLIGQLPRGASELLGLRVRSGGAPPR